MAIIKQKLADIIKHWISLDKSLADNDARLIANVLYGQLGTLGYDVPNMTAMELLKVISSTNLYSPTTISRNRRKVQEQYPEYRGNKYNERHGLAEKVRTTIKNIKI